MMLEISTAKSNSLATLTAICPVKESATKIVSVLYKEGDDIPDGSTIGDDTGVTEVKPFIQAVDYAKLTPLLTAALKEAIAKIETLETKVQALEDA